MTPLCFARHVVTEDMPPTSCSGFMEKIAFAPMACVPSLAVTVGVLISLDIVQCVLSERREQLFQPSTSRIS